MEKIYVRQDYWYENLEVKLADGECIDIRNKGRGLYISIPLADAIKLANDILLKAEVSRENNSPDTGTIDGNRVEL